MNSPTPLQILLSILTDVSPDDAPSDAAEIRRLLRRSVSTPRQHEVAAYLIAASDGLLGRQGSSGSLKHVVWWLRDNAGELYVPAARETLRAALDGTWPLSSALPHLQGGRVVGQFLDAIGGAAHAQALLSQVREVRAGSWRVAVYEGTRNLLKPAMRAGFDVYAALSDRGGVVKVRRGLSVDASPFPGWKQVYPDLLILEGDWSEGMDGVVKRLPEAVRRGAGNARKR